MKASDIPTKFQIPFASSAVAPFIRNIPQASQIGIQAGAASLTDGFPPATFLAVGAGGTPPFGQDFNGLLKQITLWNRWGSAGGPLPWDSAFSTAIGGYPQGAIVQALIPGSAWISTADDNTTNPDIGGANWSPYGDSTGDAKITFKTVADYGWIMATDGTIGNAASNATYANAFAAALFALVWNGITNTNAPLLTSAGAPVARGANAAADFAANRQLTLPKELGRSIAIAGAGSGLTAHALGQTDGAESQTIAQANLPAVTLNTTIGAGQGSHQHGAANLGAAQSGGGVSAGSIGPGAGTTSAATLPAMTGNTPLGGSGTPLPTIPPRSFWNVMIKL